MYSIHCISCVKPFSGGVDFHSVSDSITFPAGSTSRLINITLIDDSTFEEAENFSVTLQIDPLSLPVTIANNIVVVVIQNDDGK